MMRKKQHANMLIIDIHKIIIAIFILKINFNFKYKFVFNILKILFVLNRHIIIFHEVL
jgi:hypothetical protein